MRRIPNGLAAAVLLAYLAPAGAQEPTKDLVLRKHSVDVQIFENLASVTRTLVVYNPTAEVGEATMILPRPKGGVAYKLTLVHNVASTQRASKLYPSPRARELFAKVRERGTEDEDEAFVRALTFRKAAEFAEKLDAIDERMQQMLAGDDPALLELSGDRQFTLKLYPVPAYTRQIVTVAMAVPVVRDESGYRLEVPLEVAAAPMKTADVAEELSVTVVSRGKLESPEIAPAPDGAEASLVRKRWHLRVPRFPEGGAMTVSYDAGKGAKPLVLTAKRGWKPPQAVDPNRLPELDRALLAVRAADALSGTSREETLRIAAASHIVSTETSLLVIEDWVVRDIRRDERRK